MTVLIVSHLFEPSVNVVISHLHRMGVKWVRLNCEEFPLFSTARVEFDGTASFGVIQTKSCTIDTREVEAVWFRRAAKSAVPRNLSLRDKEYIQNECGALLSGVFDLIGGKWINFRGAEYRASSKLYQLALASGFGFTTPKTLVTNDPGAVRKFASDVDGRIIFKPVSGYAPRGADFSKQLSEHFVADVEIGLATEYEQQEAELVFAQILTPEKLDQIESLHLCPATFQEYIDKTADIRVTIVGDRVFSCRICSQVQSETAIDFRRMVLLDSLKKVPHEVHNLPDQVEDKLRRLMNSLGLTFGCIDLLETKTGEYVFLEVNPSGQWMWIEQMVGHQISVALAEELARARAHNEGRHQP